MAVYDFFLSRNNSVTGETYIGHQGRLFYDDADGLFRLSDGATPGGTIVANLALAKVNTTQPTNPQAGEIWLNPVTFELGVYHNGSFIPTIDIATETKIGGIKLGPGVTTNAQGQLIIDSAGLEFSFGDFGSSVETYSDSTAYALLQTVNLNEDAVIASNGTGRVAVVGEFSVHATNGSVTGSLETDPVFKVSGDGQVQILVPDTDTNFGAVEIIGSATGNIIAPGQPGSMLHLTGQPAEQCRVYMDGNGNYASIVGRRWNGTVDSPTQVLANEDILRINATAATDAGVGNIAAAQMRFMAIEDHTTTAQGSQIDFVITPLGQPANNRVSGLIIKADGIELPRPDGTILFNGNTSGTIKLKPADIAGTNTITLPAATGTAIVTAGANTVTGVLAGTLSVDPPNTGKNGSVVGTYTISGLTTSHKVVVMPQAALPDNFNIGGAWASATNTLSINFQTYAGGIDAAAFTLAYWAWI
jgi:hypothetical protein